MGEVNPARVLVLGLGNVLLQDEGLGVKALKRLVEQYHLPDNVRTMDGGTLGMHLFPYLDGCTHLLILDAVETNSPPGTLSSNSRAEPGAGHSRESFPCTRPEYPNCWR